MRSEAVARALADRLARIAPPGISVRAHGTGVLVSSEHKPDTWDLVTTGSIFDDDEDERPDIEKLEVVAYSVVNGFQAFVSDVLAMPWPGEGPALPAPNAEVTLDGLRLWYGDIDSPELELEPVPLDVLE